MDVSDVLVKDKIKLFVQLAFEKSDDYTAYRDIVKTVGINSIFRCSLIIDSTDEGFQYSHEEKTSFLFISLFYEDAELIRFLLENGADPNGAIDDDSPPIWDLQYAYKNPEYGLAAAGLLLKNGADPNYKWEGTGFYTYVDTKPADLLDLPEEGDYLLKLCDLLSEFGGKYDWEE